MKTGSEEESRERERLHASLRRLVRSTDAERRAIERELHDGVQQHLAALAVDVQLAAQAAESEPATATARLAELARDVQLALEETGRLAERIYPATLEAGGLAVLLRSAASRASMKVSVDVATDADVPAEVALTVYLCWRDALARAGGEGSTTIEVREGDDTLDFEVLADGAHPVAALDWLQDRVEALGGRVTIARGTGGRLSVSGSLPLGR